MKLSTDVKSNLPSSGSISSQVTAPTTVLSLFSTSWAIPVSCNRGWKNWNYAIPAENQERLAIHDELANAMAGFQMGP